MIVDEEMKEGKVEIAVRSLIEILFLEKRDEA